MSQQFEWFKTRTKVKGRNTGAEALRREHLTCSGNRRGLMRARKAQRRGKHDGEELSMNLQSSRSHWQFLNKDMT